METKTNKLNARDFIFIGIFAAVALLIFFITGALAALTLFGTIANIPITLFFVSIAFMLAASKVRKTGVFFIMGIIIVLPGFMAANGIGVGLSILGWFIAETLASTMKYKDKKKLFCPMCWAPRCRQPCSPCPCIFRMENTLCKERRFYI